MQAAIMALVGVAFGCATTVVLFTVKEFLERKRRCKLAERILRYYVDILSAVLEDDPADAAYIDLSRLEPYLDIYLTTLQREAQLKSFVVCYLNWRRGQFRSAAITVIANERTSLGAILRQLSD